MAERAAVDAKRYTAFISYSHKDAAAGRWLHRKLEGYRLPKRLVGVEGEDGIIPARLGPVFRDRDELPAAGDLSEKVRAALTVSRHLIVLCSPNSAASPWVAKEIETFRELHPGRPVFTAIVDGEPGQSFSPALLADGVEPLAADLRKEGDGRRLGLLKLVAGLAGVGLDALVQRDAARRVRRVTYVTAGALAAMLVMALLTAVALNARADAERQRAEAEGLVEFMLTDLRDRLKGVGRLDVLTAVNRRALAHYQGQDLDELEPDELERRARILHAMGEDDEKRGLTDRALAQFQEAARATAKLLEEDPENPDRIYAHAQSEFWVGYIDYSRHRYAAAKPAFKRYRLLAAKLVTKDPNNVNWLREAGYADGNLCTLALAPPGDARSALEHCTSALARMERISQRGGGTAALVDLINRHAWVADAWRLAGNPEREASHRRKQHRLANLLVQVDTANLDNADIWVRTQIAYGEMLRDHGNRDGARASWTVAASRLAALRRRDRTNASWQALEDRLTQMIGTLGKET
jgi:tetratricopeptide (TPR) repeat protein